MKSPLRYLVHLTPLIGSTFGQYLSANDATLLAWRAYGDFVTDYLTAGVGLVKGTDFVYVTPPSLSAIRGGSPVPFAVQNFDLFAFADALQGINEPLLNPQGPSYEQNLGLYVSGVGIGTNEATAAQLAQIASYQTTYTNAQTTFFAQQRIAYTNWLNDPFAQAIKQSFSIWVTQNDALYLSYQSTMNNAAATLLNYQTQVYGSLATLHKDDVNNILLATDARISNPGYNMPVYPSQYNVQFTPFNAPQFGPADGITYKPQYIVQGSFQNICDAWFNGTGGSGKDTSISWNLTSYSASDWTKLGHSTSVKQIGGSWYSILSAQASSSSSETTFDQWTTKLQSAVTVELTMKGTPVIFNIGAGYWDVPDFRTLYPTLLPGATDLLKDKVRLQKVLLAYEVGLTITFNDASLWTQASTFISTAQKNIGGGLSIFGFKFGASSTSTYQQSLSSVKTKTAGNVGKIVLPPTAPGVTVMLGALGKKQ